MGERTRSALLALLVPALIAGPASTAGNAAEALCSVPEDLGPELPDLDPWCSVCVSGGLEKLGDGASQAAALNAHVDREIAAIASIVRYEETGSAGADYSDVHIDVGSLVYGAYQFRRSDGHLLGLLRTYQRLKGDGGVPKALTPYLRGLELGKVYDQGKTFRLLLRRLAADPVMRQAQDQYFRTEFVEPALADAARLGIRSPLAAAVLVDLETNGGLDSVLAMARHKVPVVSGPADEARFVKALLDSRERFYTDIATRHPALQPYLKGWLRRVKDFREIAAAGDYNLIGGFRVRGRSVTLCGASLLDARGFRLWMASQAEG